MATETITTTNKTAKTDRKQAIIGVCCLAFFPLLYLIGITIKNFLG